MSNCLLLVLFFLKEELLLLELLGRVSCPTQDFRLRPDKTSGKTCELSWGLDFRSERGNLETKGVREIELVCHVLQPQSRCSEVTKSSVLLPNTT